MIRFTSDAFTALQRFGLGPRGDRRNPAEIGGDPRGALLADLQFARQLPDVADLTPSPLLLEQVYEFRRQRRAANQRRAPAMDPGKAMEMAPAARPSPALKNPAPAVLHAEAAAQFERALDAPIGFAERLLWFWSNHFCIDRRKAGELQIVAGAYEREAIRPHLFGRFEDMLLAVVRHPAMLIYLDNRSSIGPNSRAGRRRGRGLNENLAREVLELHTLGVGGGYGQDDVIGLARALTGWTVAGKDAPSERRYRFRFNRNWHEPGAHVVLGQAYAQGGVEQGEAVLRALAHHPSTARFIATKLARHFVSDEPPAPLVEALAARFQETGGDLSALYATLVGSDHAWGPQRDKIRMPREFLAAACRATGLRPNGVQVIRWLQAMGEPLWSPTGPDGFPDDFRSWATAEGLTTRLDLSVTLARRAPPPADPMALADAILGPAASRETRETIMRAESRHQALVLLLMSPEFQRR